MEVPFEVEPYEGKDPNTSEENCCSQCLKQLKSNENPEGVERLMICSGCQCIYYCSKECQKDEWSNHKKQCKAIRNAEKRTERLAASLRSSTAHHFMPDAPPENLFETSVGRFWGIFETRDYMRARMELADAIYDIAYQVETVELWEKVRFHYQEMLRLSSSDNMGVRFNFPFILLYLNLDDDAYSFCRYWLNWSDNDYEAREERHENSSHFEWLYPKEEGCRYLDIFEQCPHATHREYMDLHFLVAICIIKMRLVASYDDKKRRNVEDSVPQDEAAKVESNRRQVKILMDLIDENNPSMLPSLINPMPFKSQPLPDFTSPGHPTEAYNVLNAANRVWCRVPGAEAALIRRFGRRDPPYNHSLSL